MKKFVKVGAGLLAGAMPIIALAQSTVQTGYIESILTSATRLLNQLVVLLMALAVVWFIWNVIKYAMSDDEDGKEKAKSQMIWGIIAIAVIVSVWGLVAILQTIFNTGTGVQGLNGSVKTLLPTN
ncbi:MAG: pilin [bacterium]